MMKTIVMIHGMGESAWCWDNYKEFFEKKGYNCITPTLRWHDIDSKDTPNPAIGTTSLLDYVSDLEKEIDKLDEQPILIGHSMGGLLAQILAERRSVKALILLSPASPYGVLDLKMSILRSLSPFFRKFAFWKKPIKQDFKAISYSMLNLCPDEEKIRIFDKLVFESGQALSEIGFWFFDPKKAAKINGDKVNCPIMFIVGEEDRITPVSIVRKIAEKYKTVSDFKVFPNHAHWLIGEPGWEKITEYIYDWIEKLDYN
ncbi:alpha/beta hydrolase [Patescibacteria group bacterium]|nr:alpha/beta hydrolase [Patescibacteria group bacterium]